MRVPTRRAEKLIRTKSDPFITKEKFLELKSKLEKMKKSQPALIEEVQRLAQMGDFSENAAYQMAKGKLRGLNQRIIELEGQLNRAELIEPARKSDIVSLGNTVLVNFAGKRKTYQILGSCEANPASGVISRNSPLGAALLGRRVGDIVRVQLVNKEVDYKIVEIK
jgi:transcription elongation factor GreA